MKSFILVILGIVSYTLQAQNLNKEFKIKGYIKGLQTPNNHVYLQGNINGLYIYDSVHTTDGHFAFSGKAEPDQIMIAFYGMGQPRKLKSISLFLDAGEITVTATSDTSEISGLKDIHIKGSHNQDELDRFNTESMKLLSNGKDFKKLQVEYDAAKKNKDTALIASLQLIYKDYYRKLPDYKFKYIRSHPGSFVGLNFLEQMMIFIDAKTMDSAKALFANLHPDLQSSINGKKIGEKMTYVSKSLLIGKPAIDFSQADQNGEMIKLSDYRGRYVLLEFWASWCGPCRAENPNVLKAYQQYKDRGFDILAVSLDNETDIWKQAVKEDKLPWKQMCNEWEKENPIVSQYGVAGVPDNFLINPDGIVVARGLRGEALHKKLAEVLSGK